MSREQDILRELRELEGDINWQALAARDARFDGIFFYGVRSTGVYCKPSCPARRPRREMVSFFPACDAAEAAGFRACLRCRPRAAAGPDAGVELVLRVCRAVEARPDGVGPTLDELSALTGVGPHHLQRTFKRVTGITPRQYAAARRLKLFKSRIKAGGDVTAAMYDAGYGSSSRLYEKSSAQLGMTPATYRRGGKDMNIDYTVADSPLGRLLVAATARGVCSVQFGERDEDLEAALRAEYPAAAVRRDETGLGAWVGALLEHLGGTRPGLSLPLDVRATAFQLLVWEELRRIPYGETRSYGAVAEALGRPTAARAVARACATNPVALATPCHRVVRGGGELGGYRWGLERKRQLLEQERDAVAAGDDSAEESMPLFSGLKTRA